MKLNIIHLPTKYFQPYTKEFDESAKRQISFQKEMQEQGIEYQVWDAILDEVNPFVGCSQSHKMIVRDAKERGAKMVAIAEDDITFFAPGAYDYFINNTPGIFDLYLGTTYSAVQYPDGKIKDFFDSLILYMVHERFYDKFLSMPEVSHLDRELSRITNDNVYRICQPIVCAQVDGYSFNARYVRNIKHRLNEQLKFGS